MAALTFLRCSSLMSNRVTGLKATRSLDMLSGALGRGDSERLDIFYVSVTGEWISWECSPLRTQAGEQRGKWEGYPRLKSALE